MRIRKGDTVAGPVGQAPGQARRGHGRAIPAEGKVIVDGVNMAKRHTEAARRHHAGRHHRQGHAAARLGRRHRLPVGRAHPDRHHAIDEDGTQGPGLPQVRDGAVMTDRPHDRTRPRLKDRYDTSAARPAQQELGLANVMEVPRLEKIVINMGVGKATQQPSLLEGAVRDLEAITGQKPVVTRARKSIAGFKLREGNAIGAKVTLRGDRMWEFFDRLIALAIPRIRDFRGLPPNVVRRPGQLHLRRHRATHLPGDRLRQRRRHPGHGHHHRAPPPATTRRAGPCSIAFGFPFRQESVTSSHGEEGT